jgi:hypothetical protein
VQMETRWASLVPMMDCRLKSRGPLPNCHTIWPAGSTSITRLLNWSAIKMLPGRLNSGYSPAGALLVARPVADAGAARPARLTASTASAAPGTASRQRRLAGLRTACFMTLPRFWAHSKAQATLACASRLSGSRAEAAMVHSSQK